ncbi:hypothetical protein NC652_009790 [Populus alba x Populus x berolinensis]|nr:hypothetical protein NC652_009790 [Populus alba x Populus x berolinensis]
MQCNCCALPNVLIIRGICSFSFSPFLLPSVSLLNMSAAFRKQVF